MKNEEIKRKKQLEFEENSKLWCYCRKPYDEKLDKMISNEYFYL